MKTNIKNSIWENREQPKVCGLKKEEQSFINRLFWPIASIGAFYITWRMFYTIDYHSAINTIAGLLLLSAELYSYLMFLSFSYITSQKCNCSCNYIDSEDLEDENVICSINGSDETLSCKTKENPTVDIFICTYNEGLDILLDTFEGCKNIDYDKKEIYVLDDGKRENVKDASHQYGFHYITRENNAGFKAGNINNALPQTNGELIVIFDADHIPVKTFLKELIDFFSDEQVAIVQTPQYFHNPDPIQKNLKLYKFLNNEQDLFFRILEPSVSCTNSTLVAGTNFMVRRNFLEEIGGLPSESITEDMALGIKLQDKGLKVYYHDKPLAAGLAPENFKEYIIQRSRWAKGTIQIFLNKHLLKYLTDMKLQQKVPYYSGLLYYMLSLPKLICVLAPPAFVILGIKPLVAAFWPFLFLIQFSYFSTKIIYFYSTAGKYRNIIFSDLYELCIWYPLLSEITKMLVFSQGKLKQKFQVTNKGKLVKSNKCDFALILPNIILLAICLLVYVFAYHKCLTNGLNAALSVNIVWNTYNVIMLALAINVGIEKSDKRSDFRIVKNMDALIVGQSEVKLKILNLSKAGAQVVTEQILPTDQLLTLDIAGISGIHARVIYSKNQDNLAYSGLSFVEQDENIRLELFRLMFANSNNW